jgi:uncharacterized protein YjbI with pentapeptide repeats
MLHRFLSWYARRQSDLSYVKAELLHKKHVGVSWSGCTLEGFCPVGCIFERCDFSNAILEVACFGGGLENSVYRNCVFDRATIRAIAPGNARFESCSFRDVEVLEFYAHTVEMVDNVFTGILKKAFFNGSVPQDLQRALGRSHNEFYGNDFSRAQLLDVAFRTGIDISQQQMPPDWK